MGAVKKYVEIFYKVFPALFNSSYNIAFPLEYFALEFSKDF
jgi:hypothetical protein